MQNRSLMIILGLTALAVVSGFNGGCAQLGRYVESTYYYPDWTPDGKIVCIKNNTTYEKQKSWWLDAGTSAPVAQAYFITTMSIAGTSETDIKEIPGLGQVVASPQGNYFAYTDDNFIRIINASGAAVTSIDCGEEINSLDWGPDETKMAYSGETTNNLFILDIGAASKSAVASPSYLVSWRSENKLVYEGSLEVFSINPDGTNTFEIINLAGYPQKLGTNEVVYMDSAFDVHRIALDGSNNVLLFNDYERASLRLSFDRAKIVGGDLHQGRVRGIWVMNIDGTGEQQLK